jgi:hypothetical protein
MKSIIKKIKPKLKAKYKTIHFLTDERVCVLGRYVGEVFDGSDKLSMAVSKDFAGFKEVVDRKGWLIVAEGDRFTNKNFLKVFDPIIIKIKDDGKKGREKRGSKQTERHLKAIATRVSNVDEHLLVRTSSDALNKIMELLNEET